MFFYIINHKEIMHQNSSSKVIKTSLFKNKIESEFNINLKCEDHVMFFKTMSVKTIPSFSIPYSVLTNLIQFDLIRSYLPIPSKDCEAELAVKN